MVLGKNEGMASTVSLVTGFSVEYIESVEMAYI